MQIKSIAKTLVAGCAIGILAGCGVPQKEVDAMVAKLNADHEAVVTDLKTKLQDTESLLNSEKESARGLRNDLNDSSALNEELKNQLKEMKTSLASANSQVSSLESQLATAKASIKSAQDMAADAQNDASTARMEAQETQRRFDELIANLIRLNKIKPEDVGFDNLSVSPSGGAAPSMDMGDMGASESSTTGSGSTSSAASLLDQMGNM